MIISMIENWKEEQTCSCSDTMLRVRKREKNIVYITSAEVVYRDIYTSKVIMLSNYQTL